MYNPTAESFSQAINPDAFIRVYREIADITPLDKPWALSSLFNRLPTLKHFAVRTQGEILRVVLRDAGTLPTYSDSIKRLRLGTYQWKASDQYYDYYDSDDGGADDQNA